MTAEIAILNKLAVALATDSAVTVSAGEQEQKTYDSADKLFELSKHNPIGIMIYHGLQFMQAPLQTLISEYRAQAPSFDTLKEVAYDFLGYLNKWAQGSPPAVTKISVEGLMLPTFAQMRQKIQDKQQELFNQRDFTNVDIGKTLANIPHIVLKVFEASLAKIPQANFVGGKPPELDSARENVILSIIEEQWSTADADFKTKLVDFSKRLITLSLPSLHQTGVVIAGFGATEKFPSLICFSVDGVVFDKLRFTEHDYVDIDRSGDKARVMPFAQKEMVERFLYGLDGEIERLITVWCKEAVPEISNQIVQSLEMSDDDRNQLLTKIREAEDAFVNDLKNRRFEEIRTSSRSSIEGMVEFMPKPELARMAEALVNLTSLKRRVSRGMDTVGGPIDVAVISRTEGFIWVKRKHYFDAALNPRYLYRVSAEDRKAETEKGGSNER